MPVSGVPFPRIKSLCKAAHSHVLFSDRTFVAHDNTLDASIVKGLPIELHQFRGIRQLGI